MSKYFSASTGGFYDTGFHTPEQIPADAVEITDEQHAALLDGQSAGKIISSVDGKPVLKDRPKPTLAELSASIRKERDARLAATDWMLMPDSGKDTTKVRAYRQALRDITKQPEFPKTVRWPTL